jgi:hypothetical protein
MTVKWVGGRYPAEAGAARPGPVKGWKPPKDAPKMRR